MKCDKCQYAIPSVDSCVRDNCIYAPIYTATEKYALEAIKNIAINSRKKKHKCEKCSWGTWTGLSYKCALPRCIPNLGDFNGVGKNG